MVVFRIGAEEWPLLERAANEHGSLQAAVLAGVRALTAAPTTPDEPSPRPQPSSTEPAAAAASASTDHVHQPEEDACADPPESERPRKRDAVAAAKPASKPTRKRRAPTTTARRPVPAPPDPDQELSAPEAAALLGIKTATARAYISNGRLPGRYDGRWKTTRRAVDAHRNQTRKRGTAPSG